MPKVTVLLPQYKHQAYLPDAVQSIIDQTFQDWELLILDDENNFSYSFETTYGILDDRIRIIDKDPSDPPGQTKRLNVGIREAKGEFIAFQDADDISFPWRLELSLAYMEFDKADLVYGDKVILHPDGRQEYWRSPHWCPTLFHLKSMGCWGSYMVRASRICFFDEDITYHNDHIWEARMSKVTKNVVKAPIPFYKQRVYSSVYKDRNGRIPGLRKIKRIRAARKIDRMVYDIVRGK